MTDEIRLTLPADSRYLDVAVAAIEALADRAGIDPDDLAALRPIVHDALGQRVSRDESEAVVLCYSLGDGYVGLRVEAGVTSYAHT